MNRTSKMPNTAHRGMATLLFRLWHDCWFALVVFGWPEPHWVALGTQVGT